MHAGRQSRGITQEDQSVAIERVGDLEVAQDLEFQRRSWRLQRIGWAVTCFVLLAALVGVFGQGPVSRMTASSEDGSFQVTYSRLGRHRAPDSLEIHLQPGTIQGDKARVWLDREYLQGVTIETMFPEPESVEAGPDRITYVFELAQSGKPTTLTFELLSEGMGWREGRVGIENSGPLRFSQFIYP